MGTIRIGTLALGICVGSGWAASCESLATLNLKSGSITLAEPTAEPAVCRVAATLRPSSDSEIKMEVWLPTQNWNGKFRANGNGGWSGSISTATLADGVKLGYASAMTDTGHEGGSARFALGHPEKLIDFGYRSTHEMTIAAKAIIDAYYGKLPVRSYFTGCSAGGRQGLMEAQRFPDDYDGIVAGAPGINWSGRAMQAMWIAQAVHQSEASYLPPSKYRLIHDAVLSACDSLDGVKDGVLEDPRTCKFDPSVLECKNGDSSNCLTRPQVEAARRIYSPVINERTGAAVIPGYERGSELGWATMAGPQPFAIGLDLFRYVVFQDPRWDFQKFNFAADLERTETASSMLNALDPELGRFAARGGKLIQYHGWNDPQISPGSSVDYFESVVKSMGTNNVGGFYRLFMIPGMAHCGGGEGASSFDMLGPLEEWVEQGHAPDRVPAARVQDGKPDRTRPLCSFPQVAKYMGSGNTDEASNFVCANR